MAGTAWVVAELPVTKVGKLDKKALRDMLAFGRSLTMTDTDARPDGTGLDSAGFDERQADSTVPSTRPGWPNCTATSRPPG